MHLPDRLPGSQRHSGKNNNDGTHSCFSGYGGARKHTFAEATAACARHRLRLCSKAELLSGICCGVGCNHDRELTWTSDKRPTPNRPLRGEPLTLTLTLYLTPTLYPQTHTHPKLNGRGSPNTPLPTTTTPGPACALTLNPPDTLQGEPPCPYTRPYSPSP